MPFKFPEKINPIKKSEGKQITGIRAAIGATSALIASGTTKDANERKKIIDG